MKVALTTINLSLYIIQSLQTNIYREHTDEHNIHCICILIGAIHEILYLFLCYNTIYCLFREVHINNSCICFICWQCTYIVSIWNTSYCSFRIISLFGNISVKTWNSFFHQGVKYFSTVISCNGAGLCSRATSNGVIIDNSAPIPGLVVVGDPGMHTRYQSHT